MKTESISNIIGRELVGGRSIIHVEAENARWLETLTAGQILKGRIMRHYGEDRYGVVFAGHERIVDSAVALSVGDVLTGRVIGVSDQSVSMQMVHHQKMQLTDSSDKLPEQQIEAKLANPTILAIMEQVKVKLDAAQMAIVSKVMMESQSPELVIKIGLYLAKLGLPISIELMRAMSRRILDVQSYSGREIDKNVPELTSQSKPPVEVSSEQSQTATMNFLAQYFAKHHSLAEFVTNELVGEGDSVVLSENINANKNSKAQNDSPESDVQQEKQKLFLLQFAKLMNAQTGAAYQHRFESLPIIIDGRVVEFDVALFDHSTDTNHENETRSQHLKFALKTQFGTIVLDARILNDHVQLQVVAESEWVAKEFEQYRTDLQKNLGHAGWVLDAAEYLKRSSLENPAMAVVEHVLAQDSLQLSI